MTPAGLRIIRAIATHVTVSAEGRLLVAMGQAVLLAEGIDPPDGTHDSGKTKKEADPESRKARNARDYRARKHSKLNGHASPPSSPPRGDASPESGDAPVTIGDASPVTPVTGGDAPPPHAPREIQKAIPSLSVISNSERGSETRVRVMNPGDASPVTVTVTGGDAAVTRITNASADGAFGMSVTAWAEGVRSVTGKPFLAPYGGSSELQKLVGAIVLHCPNVDDRVAWARGQGAAFASTNKGKLSAHSFVDWLNSPRSPVVADTPDRYNSATQIAERRQRDEEWKVRERDKVTGPQAVSFATAALAAISGPKKAGRR